VRRYELKCAVASDAKWKTQLMLNQRGGVSVYLLCAAALDWNWIEKCGRGESDDICHGT